MLFRRGYRLGIRGVSLVIVVEIVSLFAFSSLRVSAGTSGEVVPVDGFSFSSCCGISESVDLEGGCSDTSSSDLVST